MNLKQIELKIMREENLKTILDSLEPSSDLYATLSELIAKADNRWMYDYILIHVARTWERTRMEQPYQEMPQDNIESAEDAIPSIADTIFENDIIQGFLNASEEVKADDYWTKNTQEEMSDWYIESVAEKIIIKNYLN